MARNKAKRETGSVGRWFGRLVKMGVVLTLFVLVILSVMVFVARSELPGFEDLKSSPNGQMIRVRASNGQVIQSLGPSFGRWIAIRDVPQPMKDAMVAVEDRRFRYHPGIDPIGMARAGYLAVVHRGTGRRMQGASTITQQLARTVFLNNNYSMGRKFREAILALALETKFSKDQILELYLNKVYFGGGAYGIDSASRRFFDHGAEKLTLGEAAIIAGLVKAPSRYSPTADAKAAIDRAAVVLQVMQDAGLISAAEAAQVKPGDVRLAAEPAQDSMRYFTDWALPQLDTLVDETMEPIDVWTTVDVGMQRAATAAIRANAPGGAQGALVAIDRNGAVRAMVGGTDYVKSNYNRAVTAQRQPGSAWKLFVYLAALEAGFQPDDIVSDEPVEIDGWSPRNSGGNYAGDITVRTAFAYSKNTVAAQIGNELGFGTIASMARRFGISTPVNTQPSMVLGTSETRLIEMTRAFAQVAARGRSVAPFGIQKVTTVDGKLLYQHKDKAGEALIDDWVAASMTDLLQAAVMTGTGRAAQIGRPVAGKTGTTNSNKDGWFLGFSSGLTTGVWFGRDDNRAVGGLQGGHAPARAWSQFMRAAVAKRPIEKFDTEAKPPEWQMEEEKDAWFGAPEEGAYVDENGMPIESGPPNPEGGDPEQPVLDDNFLDRALDRPGDSRKAPVNPPPVAAPAPPAARIE